LLHWAPSEVIAQHPSRLPPALAEQLSLITMPNNDTALATAALEAATLHLRGQSAQVQTQQQQYQQQVTEQQQEHKEQDSQNGEQQQQRRRQRRWRQQEEFEQPDGRDEHLLNGEQHVQCVQPMDEGQWQHGQDHSTCVDQSELES